MLVGPPRRVRWVTGPSCEISSVVSARGRNFYGGVWARDAFNGLRLWQQEVKPSPAQGGFSYRSLPGSVRPVAAGDRLFVVREGTVTALDGATGEPGQTYPEAGTPRELLVAGDLLLAIDGQAVHAVEVDSGRRRWQHLASEPRLVVASDTHVFLLTGTARKGEPVTALSLDLATGTIRWRNDEWPWLPLVRRLVCSRDLLVCEVSTVSDTKEGNAIHVVTAADGRLLWGRAFVPGMNHMKQARAMFIGGLLWVLEQPRCVALDPRTGAVQRSWPAGLCHCFPPVATSRFLFSGEMELTDLMSGALDANRITKAACGRDAGWMPANGLIYVSPKHCVCWPMLRGYVALAPDRPRSAAPAAAAEAGSGTEPAGADWLLENGTAPPPDGTAGVPADEWPCYRRDAWRSSSTPSHVPAALTVRWTAAFESWPPGLLTEDWRENPFVRGPVSAPVVAGGRVYVARPDAHEVVALDAATGQSAWRFTANGRVDTPPTIHRGLCLFGTRSGWVYCLRADDGRLVWRLRAAAHEERIVAYGQLESPWPVPGSVLVSDDVAYFAAGRQSLADGGVRVFAVEPATGHVRWMQRLTTVPTTNFYGCNALEFDAVDLLHQEGEAVALSRWLFHRTTGQMTCQAADAFAVFKTETLGVAVPRGCWTYGPRHQPRHGGETSPLRPLAAFQGPTLWGCLEDLRTVYRRDFNLHGGEPFPTAWITGWAASEHFSKRNGEIWRSDRLAQNPRWSVPLLAAEPREQKIASLVAAGDQLLVAGSQGGLWTLSAADGQLRARSELPAPLWDGLAVAAGCVFATTQDGRVLCLGKP